MTPDDIARARTLCDAATPGRWVDVVDRIGSARVACLTDAGVEYDQIGESMRDDDAAFIAAARTLLPAALDEIEQFGALADLIETKCDALRTEVDRMRPVMAAAEGCRDSARSGLGWGGRDEHMRAELIDAVDAYRAKGRP